MISTTTTTANYGDGDGVAHGDTASDSDDDEVTEKRGYVEAWPGCAGGSWTRCRPSGALGARGPLSARTVTGATASFWYRPFPVIDALAALLYPGTAYAFTRASRTSCSTSTSTTKTATRAGAARNSNFEFFFFLSPAASEDSAAVLKRRRRPCSSATSESEASEPSLLSAPLLRPGVALSGGSRAPEGAAAGVGASLRAQRRAWRRTGARSSRRAGLLGDRVPEPGPAAPCPRARRAPRHRLAWALPTLAVAALAVLKMRHHFLGADGARVLVVAMESSPSWRTAAAAAATATTTRA